MNLQDTSGDIELNLGVKGILYFEMEAIAVIKEADTVGDSRLVQSNCRLPVWRLIHALGSLTSLDGNTILVGGITTT